MAASMHLPAGGHNRRFSSEAARDGHESREEIDPSASCFQIETASLSRRITVAVDELSCGPAGEGMYTHMHRRMKWTSDVCLQFPSYPL